MVLFAETKSNTNEPFFEWHAASIRALVFYIEHLWHHELDEKLEATGERFKKMQEKLEEFYFNDEKRWASFSPNDAIV